MEQPSRDEIIGYVKHGILKRREFNTRMGFLLGRLSGVLQDECSSWIERDSREIDDLEGLMGKAVSATG